MPAFLDPLTGEDASKDTLFTIEFLITIDDDGVELPESK